MVRKIRSMIIVCLAAMFFIATGCGLSKARIDEMESGAKSTLRSMGTAQMSYSESARTETYGTFNELLNSGHIPSGSSKETMIEGYTLYWEMTERVENFNAHSGLEIVYEGFIIIADPLWSRTLATYAITEDQLLRVYNRDEGNDYDNVKTWEVVH